MESISYFFKIPTTRSERWQLIKKCVADWYAPIGKGDGFNDKILTQSENRLRTLGSHFPLALKEWYKLAGKREDIWSKQDHFSHPCELLKGVSLTLIDKGFGGETIEFYFENQGGFAWSFLVNDHNPDDPSVWINSEVCVSESLSLFAIQALASYLKCSDATRWINGWVNDELIKKIQGKYPELPIDGIGYPGDSRFWGNRDLMIEVINDGGDDYLFAVSRTVNEFEIFYELLKEIDFYADAYSED